MQSHDLASSKHQQAALMAIHCQRPAFCTKAAGRVQMPKTANVAVTVPPTFDKPATNSMRISTRAGQPFQIAIIITEWSRSARSHSWPHRLRDKGLAALPLLNAAEAK
jgi:hypothetical protein